MTWCALVGRRLERPSTMPDLATSPGVRRLERIGRLRVTVGFAVAVLAFWLATPTWSSLAAGAAVAVAGETLRVWAADTCGRG